MEGVLRHKNGGYVKMKLKRMLALVLTIAMMLTVAVLPVNAASDINYTDVAEDHWSEGSIYRWTDAGVVQGTSTTEDLFAPGKEITRMEVAQILANMLGLTETVANTYVDVVKGEWYEAAILACAKAGILQGTDAEKTMMSPTREISRQEVFVILARALDLTGSDELKAFADATDLADWAAEGTQAIVSHQVIKGRPGEDGNLLAPLANITRAEVVKMLDRAIGAYVAADGTVSATSDNEPVGNLVVVNANCTKEVVVSVSADGKTATVTIGEKTTEVATTNGRVYVVAVGEETKEVKANETVKVQAATKDDQATIHTCEYTYTGSCAAGQTGTCACGATTVLAPAAHEFDKGVCTVCGAKAADAMKFALSIEAGEGSVSAIVTDDYVAVIEGNYAKVNASKVTLKAEMQNVASLKVGEKRSHEVTIDTGLTGDPDLAVWLSNAKNFKDATVVATIDGKEVTYEFTGTEGTIVAAPTEVADARAAWQALAANVTTSEGTDSKVIIAKDSTLQIAGEKLVVENELVLDNFSEMGELETEIRDNVKLVEGKEALVVELKAGTALAVGSSVATLDKDATVTVTGIDNAKLEGILSTLQKAESTQAMAESLVKLINEVIGSVDAADDVVKVDITFAK